MSNRWGIPKEVEELVKHRDQQCVYCSIGFDASSRKTKATWEHIINDIRINGPDNIALCCASCNASKGSKLLIEWLNSNYCSNKGIKSDNVSEIVKAHLKVASEQV